MRARRRSLRDEARVAERVRQRGHRAARKAGSDKPKSRAGPEAQASEIVEKTLQDWDEKAARSRADLRRQVMRIVGEMSPNVGHPGP